MLRGTDHPAEARQLLAFLQSPGFQQELPLTLFVYPADATTPLPEAFTRFSVIADNPYTVEPAVIAANREQWQDQWTEIVLR